jgi:hypothetical protein
MPVPVIPTLPKRLRILGAEELDALYGRPHFMPEERQEYCTLSPPKKAANVSICRIWWNRIIGL